MPLIRRLSALPLALFFLAFCLLPAGSIAQVIGGRHVFQFMTLSPSARITALGGAQITVRDDDVTFAATNPGALNPAMIISYLEVFGSVGQAAIRVLTSTACP